MHIWTWKEGIYFKSNVIVMVPHCYIIVSNVMSIVRYLGNSPDVYLNSKAIRAPLPSPRTQIIRDDQLIPSVLLVLLFLYPCKWIDLTHALFQHLCTSMMSNNMYTSFRYHSKHTMHASFSLVSLPSFLVYVCSNEWIEYNDRQWSIYYTYKIRFYMIF